MRMSGSEANQDKPDQTRNTQAPVFSVWFDAFLPHVAGDYMGEHWLASFALLALTA